MESNNHFNVAIIGAGPAGLFAADELSKHNIDISLFNRDIKPGGLAEYGIYPDKHQLKNGLRKQFNRILNCPNIHYMGNVLIGKHGDFKLEDIFSMGFDAILSTVGAQGTKWLGLPGEKYSGVYHAKELVYHYNGLPPYSNLNFDIGKNVVIIGVGSVMTDVANYLINSRGVEKVTAIARRGPAEIKFSKKDLIPFANVINKDAIFNDISRVSNNMAAVGQDPEETKQFYKTITKDIDHTSDVFSIRFLLSLSKIIGDDKNNIISVEFENNKLENKNGTTRAIRTGSFSTFDADTVIFAIGDKVDENFGLPMINFEFAKQPHPKYPINGDSYEVYDPITNKPIDGIFVAGWARKASTGKVGIARRDGTNGANALLYYLKDHISSHLNPYDELVRSCNNNGHKYVFKNQLDQILTAEEDQKKKTGNEYFTFSSNKEMFKHVYNWDPCS